MYKLSYNKNYEFEEFSIINEEYLIKFFNEHQIWIEDKGKITLNQEFSEKTILEYK